MLNSWVIFAWGENSQLHKWQVSSTGALTYVAESHEYASDSVREKPPGGMPGGFCSGSSNGADPNSALLFCTIPYGDANANVVNGRFLVYDPVHLAGDGSLKVLWDSQRWNVQFLFNKFDPPVVDGGQIYVPNYNGGVDLYRLAAIRSLNPLARADPIGGGHTTGSAGRGPEPSRLARRQCEASGIELEIDGVKARVIGDLRENFWVASVFLPFPPEKISQRLTRNGLSSAERPEPRRIRVERLKTIAGLFLGGIAPGDRRDQPGAYGGRADRDPGLRPDHLRPTGWRS